MTGDSLNLLVAAVSVAASIAISYYFYRRAKKERRPVYVVTGNPVVMTYKERDIVVLFGGSEVPVVTRTIVTFWNAGQEPIRAADVVEGHDVHIEFPTGTNVLDALVMETTRPEIDFACKTDSQGSRVLLSFSHLNFRDGAAVEVLHTGEDPFEATVAGAIVGVSGPPVRIRTPLWDDPLGFYGTPVLAVAALAGGVIAAFLSNMFVALLFFGASLCMAWLALSSWSKDRRRLPGPLRQSLGPSDTN